MAEDTPSYPSRRIGARRVVPALALAIGAAAGFALVRPALLRSSTASVGDYVNFEGLQVHPLAITPDGTRLLAVNTPDARLEVFTIGLGSLTRTGEVKVGLEPVSVAVLDDQTAWVVNHVSDDVSIVNLATKSVTATVRVGDEPTDVAFAGSPARAFVCVQGEDAVKIYGLTNPAAPALDVVRPVFGRHPRALASAGNAVYVGILDAGNRTTILSAQEVAAGGGPPAPDPARTAPGPAPAVGLIVQDVSGDWVDERPASVKTWNSAIPYTIPDQDVHVIDATSGAVVRTITDVGTNLFGLVVAPGSGDLFVTCTEASNRTRFEPNLRGRFLQNRLVRVAAGGTAPSDVWHLNEELYQTPAPDKNLALSQPMGVVVNTDGSRAYVAALGSDHVGVVSPTSGLVLNRIATSNGVAPTRLGPTGLALDESRNQLYVLNRFANTVAILNTSSETCVAEVPLRFDPSPSEVRDGRRFLYDGTLSTRGDLACASCHVGGDTDQIAWDLGNPQGAPEPVPPGQLPQLPPFDPMKGPMTTQTLRGLRDASPFHWRGDRADFSRFNPAFVNLMGNSDSLPAMDMQRFSDFVMTLAYPPNPNENLDGSLPNPPAPAGSPFRGRAQFDSIPHDGGTCANCHSFPAGTNRLIIPGQVLQESQGFKVPQLRNMYRKTGFTDAAGSNKRGFGFLHDGSIDNLFTFLHLPVFNFANDQQRRDLEAFLHAFHTGFNPSVGRQLTVNSATKDLGATTAQLDSLYSEADRGACDLVAQAYVDDSHRGYLYRGGSQFESDYNPEGTLGADALRALPDAAGETVTYLGVPFGSGKRMGIDRDRDGYSDRWETALGSDPANPASIPYVTAVDDAPGAVTRLLQNAPNPFNPMTAIPFDVGRSGPVKLHVFDVSGRLVRRLVDRPMLAGRHVARWDGKDDHGRIVASGRYFYRLRVGPVVVTRTMALVR